MNKKDIKSQIITNLKSFWNFLWNEDSIWSWIVNILIAFILIKFIIYPGIGFALGTNLPVVAVISESMEHDGKFDIWWESTATCEYNNTLRKCSQSDWYESRDITKEKFLEYSMNNGFNKGDIIILKGVTFENLKVGDILVFQSKLAYPVIHRVVLKNDFIETKGDHNQRQLTESVINEKYITKDQIIGKAWIKIPYLGYVKIWFTQLVQCITFNGCKFG
jgi:signal peptidase I